VGGRKIGGFRNQAFCGDIYIWISYFVRDITTNKRWAIHDQVDFLMGNSYLTLFYKKNDGQFVIK